MLPVLLSTLIRPEVRILDNSENPFRFESYLNIADPEQARLFIQLANQGKLYLAFYGDDLNYRYTKVCHDESPWQNIDEIAIEATDY